jgi:hypothetical protein
MKRYITAAGMVTLLIFCFTLGDAIAGKRLLDDFSGTYMSAKKWLYREFVREVAGGKLVSKLGNDSGSGYVRNGTNFQNPGGITKIACTITVVDVKADTGTNTVSFARIGGEFYNVLSSGGLIGDIWAEIQIGDRGNGLEAFWEVEKALDDEFNTSEIMGSGTLIPPGTLQTGIPYQVELEYTDEHDIILRVAGQSVTFVNAGWQRPPVGLIKQLATGIDADGGSGTGYVSALFDDVFINGEPQAYDTFNSALIDTTKWIQLEYVREISNGKLRMNGRVCNPSDSNEVQRANVSSSPAKFDRRYIEARMLIKSDTQVPDGQEGYARFGGWYYNDSRGPGSGQGYNEYEGNVWVTIRLRIDPENGPPSAIAGVWRSDADPNNSPGQSLLWQTFPIAISYDTEYTLSIEFTGSNIIFRCNDLEPITYAVQTPMYEPYDGWAGFQSRVFASPGQCGYSKATFDDVYIYPSGSGPGIPLLLLDQ